MKDQIRVERALDLIQQAQWLIDDAGQSLCPVEADAGDVWSETTQLYFEIKRHWHRVNHWYDDHLRQNGRR